MEQPKAYEAIYQDYLERLATVDLSQRAPIIGGEMAGDAMELPLFGRVYKISAQGVQDDNGQRPHHIRSVILFQSILLCPEFPPKQDLAWTSFKDFPDASPYVEGFANTVERPLEQAYSGNVPALAQEAAKWSGTPWTEDAPSCDLAMTFTALPKIPLAMIFHDADEMFGASCKILVAKGGANYLDMECLAMLGQVLSHGIRKPGSL